MIRIVFAAMAALVLGACYETPRPACAFACGAGGTCPDGYRCDDDGWCKLPSAPPDTMCGAAAPDARGTPDGSSSAPADAPGTPDAAAEADVAPDAESMGARAARLR